MAKKNIENKVEPYKTTREMEECPNKYDWDTRSQMTCGQLSNCPFEKINTKYLPE